MFVLCVVVGCCFIFGGFVFAVLWLSVIFVLPVCAVLCFVFSFVAVLCL